jgi:hypothetical protein
MGIKKLAEQAIELGAIAALFIVAGYYCGIFGDFGVAINGW